ncbi:uncharacterized protein T551_00860 [Pneumocystis jirovecii RU7]|uniref:Spo7-like protein n=1 Tax=Pneumocystis jirovecii (strain RU7) TaxID=1408657 RepID=A0A0W4ZUX8_PNEJ7|nr:uncharacterized protein T551_00860 [Pneumocystis jirovecii RU7]KTW32178.1 hypothetical protein T551_00860 [Pneumocystis jirovecii RU7]
MTDIEFSGSENEKSVLFIYHNLLMFEESLRQEYISLYLRRRKYSKVFFLWLLSWIVYFFYGVFIVPSNYYYVSLLYRLCLLAGVITLLLFYLSGLYSKTLMLPLKFIPYTNKCLRPYNLKIVPNRTIKSRLLRLLPHRMLARPDYGEGGVRLVLLSKGFDRSFCEGWEMFRQEYWASEQNRLMQKKDKKRVESASKYPEKLSKKKKKE